MPVSIRSIGVDVPERRVPNAELARYVDTTDEWIRSHTGIGSRHVAADGDQTSDLAARAGRSALERAGIAAAELDLIVVATATPDFFGFPSTACIVQEKLGARGCAAFDLAAGCTGFIYALATAAGFLEATGGSRALVVGAETLTRIANWEDRSTCVLLGDGAGAVVLARGDGEGEGILRCRLGADGSGSGDLRLVQPERRATFSPSPPSTPYLEMDGKKVYDFAVRAIAELVGELATAGGRGLEDIAWIVPHQANARIIQAASRRLRLPEERFYMNIEEYANTSSASIPLALHEMEGRGLLKRGDLVMLLGFGAGLTYGGAVIKW